MLASDFSRFFDKKTNSSRLGHQLLTRLIGSGSEPDQDFHKGRIRSILTRIRCCESRMENPCSLFSLGVPKSILTQTVVAPIRSLVCSLSVSLSFCISLYLSLCLSVSLSFCLLSLCLSVSLSLYLPLIYAPLTETILVSLPIRTRKQG